MPTTINRGDFTESHPDDNPANGNYNLLTQEQRGAEQIKASTLNAAIHKASSTLKDAIADIQDVIAKAGGQQYLATTILENLLKFADELKKYDSLKLDERLDDIARNEIKHIR